MRCCSIRCYAFHLCLYHNSSKISESHLTWSLYGNKTPFHLPPVCLQCLKLNFNTTSTHILTGKRAPLIQLDSLMSTDKHLNISLIDYYDAGLTLRACLHMVVPTTCLTSVQPRQQAIPESLFIQSWLLSFVYLTPQLSHARSHQIPINQRNWLKEFKSNLASCYSNKTDSALAILKFSY